MVIKGNLLKWTNYVHGWQPRYFILKNGILLYHKSEEETSFGCRGAIAIKASTLTPHEFDCCRFDVGVCDYVWYLRASTKQERDRWIKALEEQAQATEAEDYNCNDIDSNSDCCDTVNIRNTNNNLQQISQDQSVCDTNKFVQTENCKSRSIQQMSKQAQLSTNVGLDDQESLRNNNNHTAHQQLEPYSQQSDSFADAQEHFEDPLVDTANTRSTLVDINQRSLAEPEAHQKLDSNETILTPDNSSICDGLETINIQCQKLKQTDREEICATLSTSVMSNFKSDDGTSSQLMPLVECQSVSPQRSVPDHPLWPKVDHITKEQFFHAQAGIGPTGSSDGWQLFAEDGLMRLYTRELEIDGLVCDPLKAVHVVKGVTGYEMCHRFFSPTTRFEWEQTVESMKVIENINDSTLVFHQVHKRIWPAAQRDAIFWSHLRKIDDPKPSHLSSYDVNPTTRPDLKLHNIWIVCNNSIERPEIPAANCVRIRLTVSLVCETYVPKEATTCDINRSDLTCKIIYSSTINPGGWAPASILRSVYKREYPKFLDNFSKYVIASTKSKPIVLE